MTTHRFEGQSAGNVDDHATGLLQVQHCQLGDEHHRANVQLEHVLQSVHQLGVVDAAEGAPARIVDQNVQFAVMVDGGVHDSLTVLVLGHVRLDGQRLVLGGRECITLSRHAVDRLLVAPVHHHLGTALGKVLDSGRSYSPTGAGYKYHLVGEISRRRHGLIVSLRVAP